jgi:hypothetical protein
VNFEMERRGPASMGRIGAGHFFFEAVVSGVVGF